MDAKLRIRERREALGLSAEEVAGRAGLSRAEYRDLEAYEDESFRVVHLGKLKALGRVLGLDLLDLFDLGSGGDLRVAGPEADKAPRRSELIRSARVALGLTPAQLADRIGFEPVTVHEMEDDPEFLDGWSVELVLELADLLGIPAFRLIQ